MSDNINASQIRAARALLNWTQIQLAEKVGVARTTVASIEADHNTARRSTLFDLKRTFEESGIEFLDQSGVRKRDDTIRILEGSEANRQLLDDVYMTMRDWAGSSVLIFGVKETDKKSKNYNLIRSHVDRLIECEVAEKILLEEGDTNYIAPKEWYRWLPKQYFRPATFQVYHTKLAIISWNPMKIIVVDNPLIADGYRVLFELAWDSAIHVESNEVD